MRLLGIGAQRSCRSIDGMELGIGEPCYGDDALLPCTGGAWDDALERRSVGRAVGENVTTFETYRDLFAFRRP